MQRCITLFSLLVCLLAIAPIPTHADAADRAAIVSAYHKIDQAFDNHDANTATAYLTPDFERITSTGTVANREQMRQNSIRMAAAVKDADSKTVVISIVEHGSTAIATIKETLNAVIVNPQTKQPHKINLVETDREEWVKTGGGWMLRKSTALTQKQTIDGRVVPNQ